MSTEIGNAGKFAVYRCDDGHGYYFEHETYGEERACRVDVNSKRQAFDYEGAYEVPAVCLQWLRDRGIDVSEIE
jgi:hypothetical protein